MIAIILTVVLCIVLLTLGVVAPRLSRRAERDIDKVSHDIEAREQARGPVGRAAARTTDKVDTLADRASELGRHIRGQ